ncbi:MAG: hypothetical protein K0Q61_2037 [Rhodococcus erythropolis]|jgi:hypothetical protein|nr:hypothetical protein [Rhodococcus erythropolis]
MWKVFEDFLMTSTAAAIVAAAVPLRAPSPADALSRHGRSSSDRT